MEDEEDRISELPGHVRQHILSFLDTKDTIKTSLLSKTWRYDWLSGSYVDFGEKFFYKGNERIDALNLKDYTLGFLEFVDRALTKNIDNGSTIRKVVLYLPTMGEELKMKTASCMTRLNKVQELSCESINKYATRHDYTIPECLLTTPNITQLSGLHGKLPSMTAKLNLPNLRELQLDVVKIEQRMVQDIIAKCTSIQSLTLISCWGFKSLRISGLPALKKLVLSQNSKLTTIEIDAPNLEELQYWPIFDVEVKLFTLVSTEKSLRHLELYNWKIVSARDWSSSNLSTQLSHIKELGVYGSNAFEHIASSRTEMSCLETLKIWPQMRSKELGRVWLDSFCVNLKHLLLKHCDDVTDDWFNQQIAQLTNLESLKMEYCDNVEHLMISHKRLTTLCLSSPYKLKTVDIDCPTLRTFSYEVPNRGNIIFLTTSSGPTALTSCDIHLGHTIPYDKLMKLLETLKHSKHLTLHVHEEILQDIGTWSHMKDTFDRPPLSETNINFQVEFPRYQYTKPITISHQQLYNIVGSLLWLCPRPQSIRLRRTSPIIACYTAKFKYKDETELDNVEGCGCYKSYSGHCWRHSFKNYEIISEPGFRTGDKTEELETKEATEGFKTGEPDDDRNNKRKADVPCSQRSCKQPKL